MGVPMKPLLSVSGLTRRYGEVNALDNVSFDIYPGEILGLIGPTGAGKTTLMACMAGLDFPQQGQVSIPGGGSLRDTLFYLPDGVVAYPELPVRQVLALFAAAFGQAPALARSIGEALELPPVYGKRAGNLSKGYRRRLLLAVALLAPQPLLMLDEPFDGLDLHQIRMVLSLLREMPGQGRTLLLSIHQLVDAERACDRFALLSAGQMLATGNLMQLRQQANLTSGGLEEVFLALT